MRVSALVIALLMMTAVTEAQVTKKNFGKTPDGKAVEMYTIKDGALEAQIITYGGILQSLKVPDKNGKSEDVVLGFDTAEEYIDGNKAFFGAIIGRYGNRIAGGKFQLDGKTFQIPQNDGPNALHGGPKGFDKVLWTGKIIPHGVELTYLSPDGEMGFPGNLTAVVRYTLVGKELKIEYSATTDKNTVVNLTNHSYFNLAGAGNGNILKDEVKINASRYTPVDATLIPTGELASVEGTPFDFRKPTAIGARIDQPNPQLKNGHGYDHTFVLNRPQGGPALVHAAHVVDPTSGRTLDVATTEPGVQFYTGNFLDGKVVGKNGHAYPFRGGFCLETHHFPDSPNKPQFPSTILRPGETFHSRTVYTFGVAN